MTEPINGWPGLRTDGRGQLVKISISGASQFPVEEKITVSLHYFDSPNASLPAIGQSIKGMLHSLVNRMR